MSNLIIENSTKISATAPEINDPIFFETLENQDSRPAAERLSELARHVAVADFYVLIKKGLLERQYNNFCKSNGEDELVDPPNKSDYDPVAIESINEWQSDAASRTIEAMDIVGSDLELHKAFRTEHSIFFSNMFVQKADDKDI